MKFNKEARIKLREEVNNKIEELKKTIDCKDEFKRLHFDPEWLDVLLFDEQIDGGYHYKTIGYTYDNLRYIDLSEVSFENVSFDFDKYGPKNQTLNFEGTNAKINFLKSYEARKMYHIGLSSISFKNLDLSNNNDIDETGVSPFEKAIVVNCDLSGTKLKITTSNVHFWNSKLYLVDLSELEMYPDEVMSTFTCCDLRETELKIKYHENCDPERVKKIMKDPNFEGCYIGGTKILSKQARGEKAGKIFYDYEAWRDGMIGDILYDMEKQVNGTQKLSGDGILGSMMTAMEEDIPEPTSQSTKNSADLDKENKVNKRAVHKANKKQSTNVGSFYGCDNVPEDSTNNKKRRKKKTLKNEEKDLNGLEAYINEDIDE